MTTKRYSLYGQNRRNLENAINAREAFKTSGEFKGEVPTLTLFDRPSGRLRGDELDAFRADQREMDYIVYSYATPIAWHTKAGEWFVVARSFTATTGRHKSAVLAGIGYTSIYRTVGA